MQKLKDMKGHKKALAAVLGLVLSVSGLAVGLKASAGHAEHSEEAQHDSEEDSGHSDASEGHGQAEKQGESHSEASNHGSDHSNDDHAENADSSGHGHATKTNSAEGYKAQAGSTKAHREKGHAAKSHAANSHSSDHHASTGHGEHGKGSDGFIKKVFKGYLNLFSSFQHKVDELKRAEEENARLKLENSHLRLMLESDRFEKHASRAQKMTQAYEWKLSQETGSKTGRTIASIGYRVPTDLLPSQLHDLGASYFRSRDDERAAVIFTFLTGQEGDDTYKTPENFMMTGISWYRLENYELADFYFDKVLKVPVSAKTKRIHGQARLWKGLVAERLGKHVKAQFWLREVLDHDPRSAEARWVNNGTPKAEQEVEREPAQNHEEH